MRTIARGLVVALLWSPLSGLLIAPGSSLDNALLSGRQWRLLGNTVLYTAVVSLLGTVLALGAALAIWQWRPRFGRVATWIVLSFVAVPATVTAASWMVVVGRVGLPVQGWIPTTLVQALALLPIAIGVILVSLRSIDARVIEAGRCFQAPVAQINRVILPLVWPGVSAAFCVIAILTVSDFTVPSLFSVNVYALDIFSQFTGGSNPAGCAWPLLALDIPLAVLIARWASRTISAASRAGEPIPLAGAWLPFANLGITILAIQCLVVLGSLGWQVGSYRELGIVASHAEREIFSSVAIAALTSIATVVLALPFAGTLSPKLWTAVIVGASLPASLTGIGTAANLNRLGDIGATQVAPVLGMTIRFLPLSIIAISAIASQVDRSPLDAGLVFMPPTRYFARVWLPILRPALIVAACVSGALSLTELGATLILVPPGATTLAIRLYNMLHYGASDEVAGIALLMVLATLLMGAALSTRPRWQR